MDVIENGVTHSFNQLIFSPSNFMKFYIYLSISLLCFQAALGQNNSKVTFEKIAEKCKDLPSSAPIKLRIKEFRVKTDNCPKELGKDFKQSLTNGLQFVKCFTALNEETKSNEKEGSDSMPLIVTGEVVHFMDTERNEVLLGKTHAVTIGIDFKVLDPKNGATLFSQSVSAYKKSRNNALSQPYKQPQNYAAVEAAEAIIILILDSLVNNQDKLRV